MSYFAIYLELGGKRRHSTQYQTKIAFLHIFTKSLVINHSTTRLNWNLQTVSLNKPHMKEDEVFESQSKVSINPCKHESKWSI